jgi:hypothetical protein
MKEQKLKLRINEFITISEAATLVGKTPSNISYLIQYDRLNRYNPLGQRIEKAKNKDLRVSRSELLNYISVWRERVNHRMGKLSITEMELSFIEVPERERTKHVHRLHPYLGKFIPQLVEYFLSRNFVAGQLVIDPFCGSGTTLVQASEMGIHSVGIDISGFNTLIAKVKLDNYDVGNAEREILDITRRTTSFSKKRFAGRQEPPPEEVEFPETESEYLKTWFAERSLKEILFFKNLIPEYEYQDLLRVLLSRTARSCRSIYHYELATQSRPVTEPYICYKHKGKICTPVSSIIPRLNFYSRDTVRRLRTFATLRKLECQSTVIEGDSRTSNIPARVDKNLGPNWYERAIFRGAGVFTSPPYLGQIDYHEQHRYAYELFGFERRDSEEIGPKKSGRSEKAKRAYVEQISKVFLNVRNYLPNNSKWFVVANDRLSLYPSIFERSGLSLMKTYSRPVEDRTERDKRPYSENIFLCTNQT